MSFWAERRSPEQYEAYWTAVAQPHRLALVRALHLLPSFKSLREVGCAVGTNLRLVRDAFPWTELSGSDLNAGAVAYGQQRLPDVDFVVADALGDAGSWRPGQFDVLISCYTLAYVPLVDLNAFADCAVRAARKHILMAEPTAQTDERVAGLSFDEWRHPYALIFHEAATRMGRRATIRTQTLDVPVDRCNALTTVTFAGEPK